MLFPNIKSAEQFLRQYVEPQLAHPLCSHPHLGLLQYGEIFSPLKAQLSIEWLNRFDELEHYALDTLFELAVQFGDREKLNEIILTHCFDLLYKCPVQTDYETLKQRRQFWFVRAFYFLSQEVAKPYFYWLQADRNSLLLLERHSSRVSRSDHTYWPRLTSHKIESILEAFFDK